MMRRRPCRRASEKTRLSQSGDPPGALDQVFDDVSFTFDLEVQVNSPWPQNGVVRATVVSGASPGYLEVTYSACWQTGEVDFYGS